MFAVPVLGRQKQNVREFKTSLSYIPRPCLEIKFLKYFILNLIFIFNNTSFNLRNLIILELCFAHDRIWFWDKQSKHFSLMTGTRRPCTETEKFLRAPNNTKEGKSVKKRWENSLHLALANSHADRILQ